MCGNVGNTQEGKLVNLCFHTTNIGRIGIAEIKGCISNLYFETDNIPQNATIGTTEIIEEAFRQLDAYFVGRLLSFSLPLAPRGTAFMLTVWKNLCDIPYGKTVSYKEIAISAGNPKACRAVGMANNRNPLPIFIPCHRVIGADRKLIGYRGGLDLKRKLLELEARHGDA